MERQNENKRIADLITSILIMIFGLIGSIKMWDLLINGYKPIAPIIGGMIASHGAFIGIIVYLIKTRKKK